MTLPPSVREGLAAGTIASLLWAVPVALRVDATVSTALALAALAGSAALILGPGAALIGVVPLQRTSPARALLAGVLLCAAPLALFAAVLQEKTHHRPLGGVTFGISSVLLMASAVVVTRRVPIALGARLERAALYTFDALAAISFAVAAVLATTRDAFSVRSGLFDAVVGVLALGVMLRFRTKLTRHLVERAHWVWLAVVVIGLATARLQPNLAETLASQAPVIYALGAWLGG